MCGSGARGRLRQPPVELLAHLALDAVEVAVELALDAPDLAVELLVDLTAGDDEHQRDAAEHDRREDGEHRRDRHQAGAAERAAAVGAPTPVLVRDPGAVRAYALDGPLVHRE